MTLYLGIDESIVNLRSSSRNAFIYVGTFSEYDSFGEENQRKSKKLRHDKNLSSLDLNGLFGFLFGIFIFEKNKLDIGIQQLISIYTLIKEGTDIVREKFSLKDEKIDIDIDGSDSFSIGGNLNELLLKKYGYGIKLNFIPQGDQKVRVIHFADAIAYILRELDGFEKNKPEVIDKNLKEKGLATLVRDDNPRIKRIIPYHLGYSPEVLEKKVA